MTKRPEQPSASPERTPEARDIAALQERYRRYILALNEGSMTSIPVDLSRIYPETAEVPELLAQVDDLKKCLDSFRPLDPAHLENIEGSLDIEYTYDSNRIEGNTLTLQETFLVVEKGLTVGGKPMKDHLEAINHKEAIDYMKTIATREEPLSERVLLDIHSLILSGIDRQNAGRYRNVAVRISGAKHLPPNPLKVPDLMADLFSYYDQAEATEHPVILAANMHEKLVTVHPFVDGNGRTARLLMNLILIRNGYVIANIRGESDERMAYYDALAAAQVDGDVVPFHRFVLEREKGALVRYLSLMAPDAEHGKGGYFLERIRSILPE